MNFAELEPEYMTSHPAIITPNDQERWPILEMASQLCELPISSTDEEAIAQMDDVLKALGPNAAGLAAIQIGYPRRIFMLNRNNEREVFINPKLLAASKESKRSGEACLSLPGMGGVFSRPKKVTLQYINLDGETKTESFESFWARAVMHEMNHLDGLLVAHHLEKELSRQPKRAKCGMKLTPHRSKVIALRRAKKKRAKSARRRQKSLGR